MYWRLMQAFARNSDMPVPNDLYQNHNGVLERIKRQKQQQRRNERTHLTNHFIYANIVLKLNWFSFSLLHAWTYFVVQSGENSVSYEKDEYA